uniref:CTP synthase (glutamine hydrolyzing) n=1 Tax=Panagrolaimus davidi TaxID=227884 RepID=A0A914QCV0_9BILA
MTNPMKENEIYTDSYESMQHLSNIAAEKSCQCKVEFLFIRSQDLDDETNVETYEAAMKLLEESHGIIVPGAIGSPGFKGVMKTCKFAREKKKPYLGIALGFQCGVMEFAQNICGIYPDSNQKVEEEVLFDTKKSRRGQHTVIFLTENSKLFELYGRKNFIEERNWNQKEINPVHVPLFIKRGLKFVGIGIDEKENGERSQGLQNLMSYDEAGYIKTMDELCKSYRKTAPLLSMQIFELQDHPYYVGVLYGPKCSGDGLHPAAPSPPFIGLIKAALHEKELLEAEKDLSLVNLNLPPAVLPSSTITAQKIIPKSDLIETVNTKPALYAAGKFDNWIETDYELEGISDAEFNYIRTLMDAFKQK